jgi:hypothetical protein
MPEETPEPPKRRMRAPSLRRFAAGALASFVAVFGVLALRVHGGDDPGLQSAAAASEATTTTSDATSTSSTAADPYDTGTSSDDAGVSSTPPASTSAS